MYKFEVSSFDKMSLIIDNLIDTSPKILEYFWQECANDSNFDNIYKIN